MQGTLDLAADPTSTVSFFVPGKPQTAGSKSAFVPKGTTRAIVVESGDRAAKKEWRADLRAAATAAAERDGWQTPEPKAAITLTILIARARPKGHMGSGRNEGVVKDAFRLRRPVERPDTVKLVRAIEDALTGILWLDDSQITDHELRKLFGDQLPGGSVYDEGVYVRVAVL